MTHTSRAPLQVWKFGGASLADAPAIRRAAALIAAHRGPLVVVASALGGITDLLLAGAKQAAEPNGANPSRLASAFLRRHVQSAKELLPRGARRRALLATIDAAAREYRDLCGAVAVLGHLEPRTLDLLVSRGERLSAAILTEAIARAGRRSTYVDAADVVVTDGHHGGAAPDLPATTRLAVRPRSPESPRRTRRRSRSSSRTRARSASSGR